LVSASLEYLEGLASEARGDLDLTREIGEGYLRVGAIQGMPNELNLGKPAKAEASLKKADELMDDVLASLPHDKTALLDSASIASDLMILAQQEQRNADALASAHKAAGRMDSFLSQVAIVDSERDGAAAIYGNIALAHVNMHLYAEAVTYARRALELARQMSSRHYRVGEFLSVLANAQRYQGDLESALQNIREARRIADQDAFPNDTVRMLDEYGILLREGYILGDDGDVNLDQPMQAIEPLQKAFDMSEQAARKDPTDSTSRSRVATSGIVLANILRHSNAPRALAVYDLALVRLREVRTSLPARRQQALVLANSSYALRSLHRSAEARVRIDAAFEILKSTKDYPAQQVKLDSVAYTALCALADQDAAEGNLLRATETYEQLLDKVMLAEPDSFNDLRDAPRLSSHYEALAALYRRAGNTAKANDMESRRLGLWRRWDSKLPNNSFVLRQLGAARRP
jgi:tetratricopeptide (TPR) repeat protein